MTVEIKYTYESEQELKDAMRLREIDRTACRVLGQLRQEMRTVVKHGAPTERDEFWYQRLFELTTDVDENISAWEF
jgi:hypothetical protein